MSPDLSMTHHNATLRKEIIKDMPFARHSQNTCYRCTRTLPNTCLSHGCHWIGKNLFLALFQGWVWERPSGFRTTLSAFQRDKQLNARERENGRRMPYFCALVLSFSSLRSSRVTRRKVNFSLLWRKVKRYHGRHAVTNSRNAVASASSL